MQLSVKSIFKTLIGTIVLLVVGSCIVEIINVSLSGIQLQQTARLAASQSAELFAQESYKSRGTGGSAAMDDILIKAESNPDGTPGVATPYVSGDFYGGRTDIRSIYNSLYKGASFKRWADTYGSNWRSIEVLDKKLNGSFTRTTMPDPALATTNYNEYLKQMDEYTDYMMAKAFTDSYMTPLNFGVPYLDKEVLTKIFKWNLTQMYSSCNSERIVKDSFGNYGVSTNGFMLYTSQARITDLEYKVYELDTPAGRDAFTEVTNIGTDELVQDPNDERKNICVVGISYSVPMAYKGITPIKRIFEYTWNKQVDGYVMEGETPKPVTTKPPLTYNESPESMVGGGFNGTASTGALPVAGKLVYYVIR